MHKFYLSIVSIIILHLQIDDIMNSASIAELKFHAHPCIDHLRMFGVLFPQLVEFLITGIVINSPFFNCLSSGTS
uniref:Uncharacterized protein n=1 Tax=Arundo donax TaxID=35708 RepID=A0A0A9BCB6_ARUDO